MDTRTGEIYPSRESAEKDLREKGVPEKEINTRLIQGTRPTLRKLRKMLRKQWAREHRKPPAGPGVKALEAKLLTAARPVVDERNITGAMEYVVVSLTPNEWRALYDAVAEADGRPQLGPLPEDGEADIAEAEARKEGA